MNFNFDWDNLKNTLKQNINKENKNFKDPREWKLSVDENENGTAIIRLMPGKGGNTPPIVRLYEHSVKVFNKPSGKYRYYINPSPSTIGKPCPVSELWLELGQVGTEEAKAIQKKISRKTSFISNIYVVNDPANEDNNGKIFYWKYGVKLYEKFQSKLEPSEQQLAVGIEPVQLFDPFKGANIILVAKKVADFRNYDDTSFAAPSKLLDDDNEIIRLIKEECIDLNEFISDEYYSSYEELKDKFAWAIAGSEIEKMALAIGSKVITKPYNEAQHYSMGSNTSQEVSQTQKTQEEPAKNESNTNQSAETNQPPFEVNEAKKSDKQEQKNETGAINVDDIDAELDDILAGI